jgi:adenine-specific DNA-methyltransferase
MGNKNLGEIYTPEWLANDLLDRADYCDNHILKKHFFEPSCGTGNILIEAVRRYLAAFKKFRLAESESVLIKELETYFHGMDINPNSVKTCIKRLNQLLKENCLCEANWDIQTGNSLEVKKLTCLMNYIVGNPPYVRTINMQYQIPDYFEFTKESAKDVYLAFYELGFSLLSDTGRLCYITPSSWLKSKAGRAMRQYVYENQMLDKIIDYEHYQLFPGVGVYCCVAVFSKSKFSHSFHYFSFVLANKDDYELEYSEAFINGKIYLGSPKELKEMKNIENCTSKVYECKVGYQTSADSVFISKEKIGETYSLPAVKAGTGKKLWIIYPYDSEGKPVPWSDIKDSPEGKHLLKSKEFLAARSMDSKTDWYFFARSQGLLDTFKIKMAVANCVKDKLGIKRVLAREGTGVFGGIYVRAESVELLAKADCLLGEDSFFSYVKALGHYRQGGYYIFTADELEKYLNRAIAK